MSKQTFTTGQILTAAQMTTLQANDYNQTVNAKVASYTLVATDAGTRITMSNASATTITVNTALFTAGDTLTITNIGAGVCTITAGTATVSSGGSLALAQYDSGILYFSSTSAAIWNGANPGDITGVTAGTGISGGGTSGTVTITNSMATEIAAKGDLIVGTGSATFDNLTAGSNGETLVADSSTSTGLRYTAGNPMPNPVINSCYDIWQRGTTFTIATNTYGPDRWLAFRGAYAAGSTMSRQLVSDTTNLPNIQYCTRIQRDVSNTSTQGINFQYWQETSNSIAYAGKTVTFSFYARAGANYSPTGNGLGGFLYTGTGTDQNGATVSYTGLVTAITVAATLTTTWQRFTGSATLATNTNEIGFAFNNTPVGTAGAADYYEVTGVQVDIGSVALPIRRNGATIQQELSAAQRYYYRKNSDSNYTIFATGQGENSSGAYVLFNPPVTMRVEPTSVDYGSSLALYDGTNILSMSTISINSSYSSKDTAAFTIGASAVVDEKFYSFLANNNSSTYLGVSAEL